MFQSHLRDSLTTAACVVCCMVAFSQYSCSGCISLSWLCFEFEQETRRVEQDWASVEPGFLGLLVAFRVRCCVVFESFPEQDASLTSKNASKDPALFCSVSVCLFLAGSGQQVSVIHLP